MSDTNASPAPPFCPNPSCSYHRSPGPDWRCHPHGTYTRFREPRVVQRYRCGHCRRSFSDQTFRTTYWLKRPDLLVPIFHRLLGCSGFRQIAREFEVSPTTILGHSARLGRHCLLFHQLHRPKGLIPEPVVLDGFISFEYSQYHPTAFHVLAGARSHFFYGFTDSELRRSGRMTARQKVRRLELERMHGRPHPRSTEREVATLLTLAAPEPQSLELHSDDHQEYPLAIRRLPHLTVAHHVTSSRNPRTANNPLFPVNLLDLLIRHSGANHKRETIAFSKRRQNGAERLAVLLVWRNYIKSFSERKKDASPAMRLGLTEARFTVREVLRRRLFPTRVTLPERWKAYYRKEINTRLIRNCVRHQLTYAH